MNPIEDFFSALVECGIFPATILEDKLAMTTLIIGAEMLDDTAIGDNETNNLMFTIVKQGWAVYKDKGRDAVVAISTLAKVLATASC